MNSFFQALIAIPQIMKLVSQIHFWLTNELEKAKMKDATLKAQKTKNTSDIDALFNSSDTPDV